MKKVKLVKPAKQELSAIDLVEAYALELGYTGTSCG